LRVLAGGEIANTQLNTPAAKANLLFQNKRKCNFRVMIPTKQFG
jgi:hypothetical protein